MGYFDYSHDRIGYANPFQYVYQLCKEFSMTIPIIEEKCTATGDHFLCYRVRCNLAKKCYVDEMKNKVQEKPPTFNKNQGKLAL